MEVSAINSVGFTGRKKHKAAKIAVLASALAVAPVNTALATDTFERSNDSLVETVVTTKPGPPLKKSSAAEGNKFGKWFWDMIDCIDENDKFNTNYMKQQGYDYYYPGDQDYDKLAESIVKSMDKNGDNEIDKKEFIDKSIEILEQQGQDYSYKEEQNMKNIVLAPLFCSLDYIGSAKDRINGTNTLNKEEIAGNLYALSKKNLKTGHFSGSAVAEEFLNIMYNYEPTGQFESERASYLNSTNNF